VIMKFLVYEGVTLADIYRRVQAQYGDETLIRGKTSEWCKRGKGGLRPLVTTPDGVIPSRQQSFLCTWYVQKASDLNFPA